MKQKNGFVISTTLYSIFGIMLLTVFYILYLLSNNRYVLTSSISDLKKSLSNEKKTIYLEFGYYGDLPGGIDTYELEKSINEKLSENNITVNMSSVPQSETSKTTPEGKITKLDHVLSANKPYIQDENLGNLYYFSTYSYAAGGNSAYPSNVSESFMCPLKYTDTGISWWRIEGIIDNKILFSKGGMGHAPNTINDNIYHLSGNSKDIVNDKLIYNIDSEPVVQIYEYNVESGEFKLYKNINNNETGISVGSEYVFEFQNGYNKNIFPSKPVDLSYYQIKINLFSNSNKLQAKYTVREPISDTFRRCINVGNTLSGCDELVTITCATYNSENGEYELEKNNIIEDISRNYVNENAYQNYLMENNIFIIGNSCSDYNTGIDFSEQRNQIQDDIYEKLESAMNQSNLDYNEDIYKYEVPILGGTCNSNKQILTLMDGKQHGYILHTSRRTPSTKKSDINESYYIVWYIPKGTNYNDIDWEINGTSDEYDEYYYVGYSSDDDAITSININDTSSIDEYESMFIDTNNKVSCTNCFDNYITDGQDLINKIVDLIK